MWSAGFLRLPTGKRTMTRFYSALAIPLLIVFAGWATTDGAPGEATAVEVTTPFSISPTVAQCGGHCHECTKDELIGHRYYTGEGSYGGEEHDECFVFLAGCGSGNHPPCPVPEDQPELADEYQMMLEMLAEVAAGEVDVLVALVEQYPGLTQVNWSRGLVQLSGPCSPEYIVAQAPLTGAQLRSVSQLTIN